MSTKVGIIAEGAIDYVLLGALLERIARDRASYDWPTRPDDLAQIVHIRKRGHGGVVLAVRQVVDYLCSNPPPDYAFIVVLLDRRAAAAAREVRRLIAGHDLFVFGTAIEEIEAWWLADRSNTLAWLGLKERPAGTDHYWSDAYRPEKDRDPKRTLDSLTLLSDRVDMRYGKGNTALARGFVDDCWFERADLNAVEAGCPRGFVPFCRVATQALTRSRLSEGRLF